MSLRASWARMLGYALPALALSCGNSGETSSQAGSGAVPVAGMDSQAEMGTAGAEQPPSAPTTPQTSPEPGAIGNSNTEEQAGHSAPSAQAVAGSGGIAQAPVKGGASGASGSAAPAAVEPVLSVIAKTDLKKPSDLEFNPYVQDELWVTNYEDSSMVIIKQASRASRSWERRIDPEGGQHFMPKPSAFAFGARETTIVDADGKMVEGTFATCPAFQDDYIGPTLWASDLRIFAIAKAMRVPPFNGRDTGGEGPGSHIDMLHLTPMCLGIAWEGPGHVYWTYSGSRSMFVKYDFGKDHGIGNADHSDGSEWRYPVAGIQHVPGVPGHMQFDRQSQVLYLVDAGNARVLSFDPASATESSPMPWTDNVDQLGKATDVKGGKLVEVVAKSYGLVLPSGLEIRDRHLYVSDAETATIHKFTLTGEPVGKMVLAGFSGLGKGSLSGITFGPDGKLYLVDMAGGRVLRLDNEF